MIKAHEWLEQKIDYEACCQEPMCSEDFTKDTGLDAGWRSYPKAKCIEWGASFSDTAPDCEYSCGWEIAEYLAERHLQLTKHHKFYGRGRRFRMCIAALEDANI